MRERHSVTAAFAFQVFYLCLGALFCVAFIFGILLLQPRREFKGELVSVGPKAEFLTYSLERDTKKMDRPSNPKRDLETGNCYKVVYNEYVFYRKILDYEKISCPSFNEFGSASITDWKVESTTVVYTVPQPRSGSYAETEFEDTRLCPRNCLVHGIGSFRFFRVGGSIGQGQGCLHGSQILP